MSLNKEVILVFLNMIVSRGMVIFIISFLYFFMTADDYTSLSLNWGGAQLVVSIIGQSLSLAAMKDGSAKITLNVIIICFCLFLLVFFGYYIFGIIDYTKLHFWFWVFVPFYIIRVYFYGLILKLNSDFIFYFILSNLFYLVFSIFLVNFLGYSEVLLLMLLMFSPCVELIPIMIFICIVKRNVSREYIPKESSTIDVKKITMLISSANSSQLSMQAFLYSFSKVSVESSAVVSLIYQLRALPLAFASSIGQVILRGEKTLNRKSLFSIIFISSVISFLSVIFYFLYCFSLGVEFNYAIFFVCLQTGAWFLISIFNIVLIRYDLKISSIISFLTISPVVAWFVLFSGFDEDGVYLSFIYILMLCFIAFLYFFSYKKALYNAR